jgi:hypothetical protein
MATKTEAIKAYLTQFTHSDLANLYNSNMECQVNVGQDGGSRVEGDYRGRQWHGWTDANGLEIWKSFRIPFNAATTPSFTDSKISFDLAKHVEGIGMTGWDWKNRMSRWVAYDFDAITGHSDKHTSKLTNDELAKVQEVACGIPWVTVRKSTSGKGLHLYVFLDGVETANHHEHAALARAILGKMASEAGFDFSAKVDICGGNMWCWHRKMLGTDGLSLIKQGHPLPTSLIPINWRDHVKVIKGRKARAVPKFIEESEVPEAERLFNELCGQRATAVLDDTHKKLIKFLEEEKAQFWWDNEHGMLVCHTYDLLRAHDSLSMKGIFRTEAQGTERGADHNCYAFPIRAGAWAVRRFTPGVKEDPIWTQDGSGWTMTYLNRQPDLQSAARAFDGVESEKGGFHFPNAELALKAAQLLGVNIDLKHTYLTRPAVLKASKDGRLILSFENGQFDKPEELSGFLNEKNRWQRIFNVQVSTPTEDSSVANLDDTVRHIVTSNRDDAGWVIRSDERWSAEPLTHVKEALKSMGFNPKDSAQIVGHAVTHPWEITNLPFQPEYPGNRKWNRDAAQFRFPPSTDKDELKFPTWLKIFNHLGSDLDSVISNHPWCKANGIISGSDYLLCWVASLFQEPTQPLPYLFFWSIEQNSGKSIFHEALSLLLTKGYQRADHALTSQSTFNGELENAILCVVEETDLNNKNSQAYNRIKDWVTAPMLSIRHLYQSPYMIQNTTHWIQCSNNPRACLVLPGDTRITMVHVPKLNPLDMIPKKEMLVLLEAEAPDFLASVLRLEIPKSNDRLNIPIVETEDKLATANSNQTALEQFIAEKWFHVPGEIVTLAEFYDEFLEYLDPSDHSSWSKIKTSRSLPSQHPKGRHHIDNHFYVANISKKPQSGEPKKRLVLRGDYLEVDNT